MGLSRAPWLLLGGNRQPPATVDLNFLSGVLDPSITFTRASVGTYFDAAGTLQTAGTNVARFDYDPVTRLPRGLLIEEARTNLLLNSATLGTQSVAVTAQAYTLSFYGTGSITLSGTSTGTTNGAGAFPARVSTTFTPTAGTLTLTVAGSVLNAQLEAGFVTSWIPTTGTTATRAVDVASLPLGAWFNATLGSLATEATFNGAGAAAFPRIVQLHNGSNQNNIAHLVATGSARVYSSSTVANVAGWAMGPNGVYAANTLLKQATAWQANSQAYALNGGNLASSNQATIPPLTTMQLGSDAGGTAVNTAVNIRRIRYWSRPLANYELQQVTT